MTKAQERMDSSAIELALVASGLIPTERLPSNLEVHRYCGQLQTQRKKDEATGAGAGGAGSGDKRQRVPQLVKQLITSEFADNTSIKPQAMLDAVKAKVAALEDADAVTKAYAVAMKKPTINAYLVKLRRGETIC